MAQVDSNPPTPDRVTASDSFPIRDAAGVPTLSRINALDSASTASIGVGRVSDRGEEIFAGESEASGSTASRECEEVAGDNRRRMTEPRDEAPGHENHGIVPGDDAGLPARGPASIPPGVTAERWQAAVSAWTLGREIRRMVEEGFSYRQIETVTGASPTRTSRVMAIWEAMPEATPEEFLDGRRRSGRRSPWADLVEDEAVVLKLRRLHAATLGASSEGATRDRRTGAVATAAKLFAREPECPRLLAPKLLRGEVPRPIWEVLGQLTPEGEALIRGGKHFTLGGPAGHRDRTVKTIGLPDGTRARMPGNWTVVWDDMSVNQPYWVEGPDGEPVLCRQSLVSRDLATGRWQTAELVARVRDAYTAADILRSVRRYCEIYGVPAELHLEQSVWASRSIKGYRVTPAGGWVEDETRRPEMDAAERSALAKGLEAIGMRVSYQTSAKGKATIEGGFNVFQRYLAGMTMDLPNIGRHAGEFEKSAREMRRAKTGVIHPQDARFPHANVLLGRIAQCFDFLNSLVPEGQESSADARYAADREIYPARLLTPMDRAAFLPDCTELTVRGCALWPTSGGRTFCFRSSFLARLGDGYRVAIRWDATEPSLGAAVYNLEQENLRNWQGAGVGELVGMADYEVPAPTTYAAEVPAQFERWTVREMHGADSDHGHTIKQQKRAIRGWVKTAFTGGLPGRPRVVTATSRDGRGQVAEATQASGATPAAPAPRTRATAQTPTTPAAPRRAQTPFVDPLLREIMEEELA